VETRRRAGKFVLGLLADLPRAGDTDPHGRQHLLARASWDIDGAREDLRDYAGGRREGAVQVLGNSDHVCGHAGHGGQQEPDMPGGRAAEEDDDPL
jgi:hypothetical protein